MSRRSKRLDVGGWMVVAGAALLVATSPRAAAAELRPRLWGAAPVPGTSYGVAVCIGDAHTTCALRCTGTLLAPNLVQLARHCVLRERPDVVQCDGPGTTGDLEEPRRIWVTPSDQPSTDARWLSAAELHVSSFTAPCGHDIGFVILAGSFEGGARLAEPSLVAAEDLDPARAPTLSVVGYGSVAQGGAPGVRSSLGGVRVLCLGGRDSCLARTGPGGLHENEALTDAVVCSGDSGGGVHVAETDRVVGAFARIVDPKGDGCGLGVLTRVDRHRLLLARAARRAARLGGYEPAAWVERAEALGNDDPKRGLGASCDADEDCATGSCVSFDGGKSRVCSTPCGACESGFQCLAADRGDFCARGEPKPEPSSCAAAPADDERRGHGAYAAGVVVALVGAARRRLRRGRRHQ